MFIEIIQTLFIHQFMSKLQGKLEQNNFPNLAFMALFYVEIPQAKCLTFSYELPSKVVDSGIARRVVGHFSAEVIKLLLQHQQMVQFLPVVI